MNADHGGFQVRSLDAAITFYTEKQGFHLDFRAVNEAEQEAYAFVSLGMARLELIQDLVHDYVIPPVKKAISPHYCLEVSDLARAITDLNANGIPVVKGPLLIENE